MIVTWCSRRKDLGQYAALREVFNALIGGHAIRLSCGVVGVAQHVGPRTAWSILYLAVFGSVFGFIMYYYLLRQVQASRVALIMLIVALIMLNSRRCSRYSSGALLTRRTSMRALGLTLSRFLPGSPFFSGVSSGGGIPWRRCRRAIGTATSGSFRKAQAARSVPAFEHFLRRTAGPTPTGLRSFPNSPIMLSMRWARKRSCSTSSSKRLRTGLARTNHGPRPAATLSAVRQR